MIFLLSGFFLILFSHPLMATESSFEQGVVAYESGEYQRAIEIFETLSEKGVSAALLYNLANSYAQVDQTGMAILNFKRASYLKPGDPDIQGNLELLRKEKGLFQEEQNITQRFIGLLGINQWTMLAAGGVVCFAMVLLLPPSLLHLQTRWRRMWAVCCLLLSIVAGMGAYGRYLHYQDGVVVAPDARLQVSPFATAASTGMIQEGRLLTPLKIHNNYALVKDETGRSGWLATEDFIQIATF
jgi:tetratricopeptide (TPR) repeat protein